MNNWLIIPLCWLIVQAGFGQSVQRPVLIGIDVAKPVLSLATPSRPAFRLGEGAVKIPIVKNRYLSIVAGYGQLRSDTIYRNVTMNLRGTYLKVGTEKFLNGGMLIGWHGLVALSKETALYKFGGTTFGDYVATAYDRQRVGVGVEGYLGYQRTLSDHLIVSVSGRVTGAGMLGSRARNEPAVVFVPGVGLAVGDPVVVGFGLGLHLFYRTNPRSVAVPES